MQRLQREADDYTMWLEHERKALALANDDYIQKQKVLEEIYASMVVDITDTQKEHREEVHRKHLHHQIGNELVRLNDTIGENNLMKVNIDIMRKEIIFAKESIKDMQEHIQQLKSEASEANKKSIANENTTTHQNNWILALKAKSEEGKDNFEREVKNLQEKLQKNHEQDPVKEEEIDGKKSKNENKKFDNPIEILKIRLKNIQNKNREKQRLLSNYTRNANVIENAFSVIKQKSGIKNIDEIVTAFTKSEEQNYALWNYVDQLGQECDSLEEAITQTNREIVQYEQLSHLNHNQLHEKIDAMR